MSIYKLPVGMTTAAVQSRHDGKIEQLSRKNRAVVTEVKTSATFNAKSAFGTRFIAFVFRESVCEMSNKLSFFLFLGTCSNSPF